MDHDSEIPGAETSEPEIDLERWIQTFRGPLVGLLASRGADWRAAEELAARWHGHDQGRLQYAFSPRYALSCGPEFLREIGALLHSRPGTHLHTHFAESREECAAVARAFPQAEDYLAVYERAGLLGPHTILAHAIHVSPREVQALAASGSAVIHCPSANLFLKSGVFPWQRHREAGIPFGLGSDVGAGPEMSPLRVMRDAALLQPELFLDPADLIWRATLGGAQALGLDHCIGSLDVGKEADLVILDPSLRPELAAQPMPDLPALLGPLIFLGDTQYAVLGKTMEAVLEVDELGRLVVETAEEREQREEEEAIERERITTEFVVPPPRKKRTPRR